MSSQTVAFIGLGYIGLPTAVVMANSGLDVIGIDTNANTVESINRGQVPIVEPGLDIALNEALESGAFRATTDMAHAAAYVIAVPTPFMDNHTVDMKYIYAVAESVAAQLEGGELIILESTSPPKTTALMAQRVLKLRPDLAADGAENPQNKPVIYFAHCPERILPGNAMEELVANDRIIGGTTAEATRRATEIYRSFCKGNLLPTNAVTAELAKLTENSFRDVNIAFANELSLICDELEVNVWELISLANHHPRVNILQPGPGVGGHCIAVDPWFIVSADPKNATLIRTAREVNDRKPDWVVEKTRRALTKSGGASIAVLGLAFKANIDDLRESPSLQIAEKLANSLPNSRIRVVEPNIHELPTSLAASPNVELLNWKDAIATSDVVVLLVDHDDFKQVTASELKGKTVVDTKGLWFD